MPQLNPFMLSLDLPSRKDIEEGTLVLVGARDEAWSEYGDTPMMLWEMNTSWWWLLLGRAPQVDT